MGDMTAFERQLAARLELITGPEPHVDAMASERSAKAIASTRRPNAMFSTVKFVVAGVIVSLFGGFLLAGVLSTPQGDEMAPATVTESPSPMTTEELLSGMVTEEVEPGVLRVVHDGLGSLDYPVDWEVPYDIVAGHDGGVYVFEPGHYTRLGSGPYRGTNKGYDWDLEDAFPSDVGVAPDGTVWALFGRSLYSTPWGSGPETRHLPTTGPDHVEVTSDGTVWAVWRDDQEGEVFGYLGTDGWTMVGEWPFHAPYGGYLRVSDRGDVWAIVHAGWGFFTAQRFVDGTWREEEGNAFDNGDMGFVPPADVGVDGTLWGISEHLVVSFDGTEWTTFQSPDWSRTDVAMRELAKDGWTLDGPSRRRWGEPHVAPDGAVWVPQQFGVMDRDPDLGGGHRNVCGNGIDGIARFDGETWSRFLRGRCVEAMDIAADGSVWMLASRSDARFPLAHVYVITPEAVAATE